MKALMIVFDSLRKDVFDLCRHPLLRDWRDRGICFENCYSQSGFTSISFASILSGCLPSNNGVCSTGPSTYVEGERPRDQEPVWWNVNKERHGNLLIAGSRPLSHSAFSLFNHRLLSWRYTKSNTFTELGPDDMFPSPEHGQDLSPFRQRILDLGRREDSLVVIRVYDTHLPYGRGISPCDAPTSEEIRHKVAAWYARDHGLALLHEVAIPALERALEYLSEIWHALVDGIDITVIMSDHGDNWSADANQVGHAHLLSSAVLHVPLVYINRQQRGQSFAFCNNVDVLPTILAETGKTATWQLDGQPLPFDDRSRGAFLTEANSIDGRYLHSTPPQDFL